MREKRSQRGPSTLSSRHGHHHKKPEWLRVVFFFFINMDERPYCTLITVLVSLPQMNTLDSLDVQETSWLVIAKGHWLKILFHINTFIAVGLSAVPSLYPQSGGVSSTWTPGAGRGREGHLDRHLRMNIRRPTSVFWPRVQLLKCLSVIPSDGTTSTEPSRLDSGFKAFSERY